MNSKIKFHEIIQNLKNNKMIENSLVENKKFLLL